MEAIATMALNMLVNKAMNNSNSGGIAQINSGYHSAKSISQLFKGA